MMERSVWERARINGMHEYGRQSEEQLGIEPAKLNENDFGWLQIIVNKLLK